MQLIMNGVKPQPINPETQAQKTLEAANLHKNNL